MMDTLPTVDDLSRMYYELGIVGARSVGEKKAWRHEVPDLESLVALAAAWSRLDPRLLQVIVNFVAENWRQLRVWRLREVLGEMEHPQTIGVVASFALLAKSADVEMTLFWRYVMEGVEPAEPQLFFWGVSAPGSEWERRATCESLSEYSKWGFLGNERIVVDAITKRRVGSCNQPARLNMLTRLFQSKKQLSISDYLNETEMSISRQQAVLDLKHFGAKTRGHGRGAYWVKKGKK